MAASGLAGSWEEVGAEAGEAAGIHPAFTGPPRRRRLNVWGNAEQVEAAAHLNPNPNPSPHPNPNPNAEQVEAAQAP